MDSDIKKIEKNKRLDENKSFELYCNFSLLKSESINDKNIINGDIFSMLRPIKNEVIVVAMLLPKIRPMLLSNCNILLRINVRVSMIIALDD